MRQTKETKLWILCEILLALLPLTMFIFRDQLQLSQEQFIALLITFSFSALINLFVLWRLYQKTKEQSSSMLRSIYVLLPLLQYMFLWSSLCASRRQGSSFATALSFIGMGLLFVVIGNFLPTCSPNTMIGVRTKWTLQNRENWNRSCRICGRIWVLTGALCWILVACNVSAEWLIALVLMGALAPLPASSLIHHQQVRDGSWKVDLPELARQNRCSKGKAIAGILAPVVAIGLVIGILVVGRQYSVSISKDHLEIQAMLVSDVDFSLQKTDSLVLKESVTPGYRSFGYGGFGSCLGNFENDEYGAYSRYTSGDGPVIVLQGENKTIVFNLPQEQETVDLFEKLAGVVADLNPQARIENEIETK